MYYEYSQLPVKKKNTVEDSSALFHSSSSSPVVQINLLLSQFPIN